MSSKSKKILGLITIVVLLLVCIGNSKTLAVSNIPQIIAGNTTANKIDSSTASGINITIGDTASDNNKNTNKNTNTNKNVNTNKNTNKNNTSLYSNSNKNSSSLPYTGTSDSVLFIVAALLVSAIYAYKKIRDYNV